MARLKHKVCRRLLRRALRLPEKLPHNLSGRWSGIKLYSTGYEYIDERKHQVRVVEKPENYLGTFDIVVKPTAEGKRREQHAPGIRRVRLRSRGPCRPNAPARL